MCTKTFPTQNVEFDKAELSLYEEVTLMKPFRRKTLVLIGASGASRRTIKHRLMSADPDQFAAPLPHTSRPKRPGLLNFLPDQKAGVVFVHYFYNDTCQTFKRPTEKQPSA